MREGRTLSNVKAAPTRERPIVALTASRKPTPIPGVADSVLEQIAKLERRVERLEYKVERMREKAAGHEK